MKININIIAIATAASLSLLLSCERKQDEKAGEIKVAAIEVARTKDIRTTPYVGKVLSAQSTNLASACAGTVEKIEVKKGQFVKAGDIIARIWSENINSAYSIAEVTLKQAEDGYDRMMQLYKDGGVTELKKIEVETQLEKARAAMKSAASAKEKCILRSPFDGIIENIFVEEGIETVPASPLVRLSNINSVEIHIPVPENEISAMHNGMSAKVEVPATGDGFDARMIVKGVTASDISHTYDCIFNPEEKVPGLLPGMVCKVFVQHASDGNIIIPANCVMTDSQGRYVWTLDRDGIVSKTRIEVSDFASEGVIVSAGLEEKDRVVTEGRRKISGGMKVTVSLN